MTDAPGWATALFLQHANPDLEVEVDRPPVDLESYLNAHGEVRLEDVRAFGFDVGDPEARPVLEDLYLKWSEDDDVLVLEVDAETPEGIERAVIARKAAKRGNDVDVARNLKRLAGVEWVLSAFSGLASESVTQLLYLTFTVGARRASASESWPAIAREWIRYKSRLRRRFGTVLILRSWECTCRGYAHIHALVAFQEAAFEVFLHRSKKDPSVVSWRLRDWPTIHALRDWELGNVDVQAVVGKNGAHNRLADVLNYVVKGVVENRGGKEVWNRAALWFLGKRSWAASRELRARAALADLTERGDDAACLTETRGIRPRLRFIFLGMAKRVVTELGPSDWFKEYKEPPPWLGAIWMPKRMRASRPAGGLGLGEAFAHGSG